MELKLNRPKPIVNDIETILFKNRTDIYSTIDQLVDGYNVLITGTYSNGMDLLFGVQKFLKRKYSEQGFQGQRKYRNEFHKLSNQILLEVTNHSLKVKKSPEVGWLEILYPELEHFLLPFPAVQGLNSAWQWYEKGIVMPVLRNKIHPFYGVYFPTRFNHIILFDNWLKRYNGNKKTAIDVGIGCGVLSFQMVKYGFQKVFGTDINPNAIHGLKESMGTTKMSRKVELECADLFGKFEKQTELIVFNPPWLPTSKKLGRLDEAIYYSNNLLPNFFEEAKKRLLPDGKIVILFSNLAQITGVSDFHPIEKELTDNKRFKLVNKLTKSVSKSSKNTKRDQNWREEEFVELWELEHI